MARKRFGLPQDAFPPPRGAAPDPGAAAPRGVIGPGGATPVASKKPGTAPSRFLVDPTKGPGQFGAPQQIARPARPAPPRGGMSPAERDRRAAIAGGTPRTANQRAEQDRRAKLTPSQRLAEDRRKNRR